MEKKIKIGNSLIGDGGKTYLVADTSEIGRAHV